MMGFFQKDYWWFFAHFASSFLFRGGCLVFMITYIGFWTILPSSVVIILVTYEFATEQSLCCKSLSSKKNSNSNYVYNHRALLKAFAMGVTNLCIMGKGKFGVDENFYKVSSSFIFIIYSMGMSISLYKYHDLSQTIPPPVVVISFASCVIFCGIANLVLVCSQMMCLCVCHEKHLRKSIRLQNCVCRCKDKADLNFSTLRKTRKRDSRRKLTLEMKTREEDIHVNVQDANLQDNRIALTTSDEDTKI